jgi:curved DNA-binding protein CbpA
MFSKAGGPSTESSESDLPVELQQELLDLRARGSQLTHYQVLGIAVGADKAAVRTGYVERSKRFHPDRYHLKKVGPFGPLLAEAFKRVSDANAVLADADARAAYDQVLSITLGGAEKKAVLDRAQARADEERRTAERRRRLFFTKGFARLGAARKLYEEALQHIEDGERALAVEALRTAAQLDPQRREIATRLSEQETELRRAHRFRFIEEARAKERAGDWPGCQKAWQAALQIDPGSPAATNGAAKAALMNRDFEKASSWAARAVEYAPRAVEPRLVLARALSGLGQRAKAKATLQELLDLNPEHKEARALLKSL